MTDRRTISGRKRRMKDKGREGRLSKHVEAASFHVKRAAHSTKSCTCATPDSAASFGSRMNYRPVRGWALSFPVHAVAPSFPPCPHPLTTAARPSPSARIGRACRQQRFPPPSLRPLLHHTTTLSSLRPLSFSISSGKIPPSQRFSFFIDSGVFR